jgi:hypothetical protein
MKLFIIDIMIPKDVFNDRLGYLVQKSTVKTFVTFEEVDPFTVHGIYAWTTNEDYLQSFIETRANDIYRVKKLTGLDKSEVDKFRKRYPDLELSEYKYWYNQANEVPLPPGEEYEDPDSLFIRIVSTKNEYENSTIFLQENMNEHFVIPDLYIDYNIFKPELKEALDVLGYTYLYDSYFSPDNDEYDRKDLADYNRSFGLTPGGNPFSMVMKNEYLGFIYLYHYPIFGNDNVYDEEDDDQ